MNLQLFIYQDLAIQFFYSPDSVVDNEVRINKLILVFPGLPQFIDKNFFQDRVNKEIAFMSVHYMGSWLSGGEFSFANCLKSVNLATEMAKVGCATKTFDDQEIKWSFLQLYAVGYSFSGNVLLSSGTSLLPFDRIILCAPMTSVHRSDYERYDTGTDDAAEFYNNNLRYLGFMKRGYKNILRGITAPSWESYFDGTDDKSIICLSTDPKKLLIIQGDEDSGVPLKLTEQFSVEYSIPIKVVRNVGHSLDKLLNVKILNDI